MIIKLPEPCVVLLIGPSGCGKSTFAKKHFKPSEILSSDYYRYLVSDDENNQSCSKDAFDLLHETLKIRLRRLKTCVIDATNVQAPARKQLLDVARENHLLVVGIVFDISEKVCQERNEQRPDRDFGPHVIRGQIRDLKRSFRGFSREFRYHYVLTSPNQVDEVEIVRDPLFSHQHDQHGPFDIIGDVHGCYSELRELLTKLGYPEDLDSPDWPERKIVFLGDLVDRGPDSVGVLKLAMSLCSQGRAVCLPGNHDIKLMRKLKGRDVQVKHGLETTLAQLEGETEEFKGQVVEFIDGLTSHFVYDGGKLVVAHAGMVEELQGRASGVVRDFALYGETTGEIDEYGLPVRYNWAADYKGHAKVVYGHTPIPNAEWFNRTIDIDTGCVFGGSLTALRYPELHLVSVPAKQTYYEPARPLDAPTLPVLEGDVLDLADISGKRYVETSLFRNITIREENATAALEAISRFAIDPRLLIYLPPTMSPCETSQREGYLEYPDQAFDYYASNGVKKAVCQEKHMGSRSVVLVGRTPSSIKDRFGIEEELDGVITTRTGRRFFGSSQLDAERYLLGRLRQAASDSGLWDELSTDWLLLDCELMPWSAKAEELLQKQYVPVGLSAQVSSQAALEYLRAYAGRECAEPTIHPLINRVEGLAKSAEGYVAAYSQYSWPTPTFEDYRLAPFHLMASEGCVHVDKDHAWHMEKLTALCEGRGPVLFTTRRIEVDLEDAESRQKATDWWLDLTESGGEGMVVKPDRFIAIEGGHLLQPAVKCRGREYLRIIYGPEYLMPQNLDRLRKRGLGRKRSMALREFALGIEGLQRFVSNDHLRRVHECVFGVLAMESEPVDPRL